MKAAGGGPTLRNPIRRDLSACCASAASGDVTTAADRRVRNCRRLMRAPEAKVKSSKSPTGAGRAEQGAMSAMGQKQTYAVQKGMSALPPKATTKADISCER